MKSGLRDKVILILMPSLFVALVWWGWLRPTARLKEAEQKIEVAKSSVPDVALAQKQRTQVSQLKSEQTALQKELKDLLARWEELRRQRRDVHSRAAALGNITDTLRRHGLIIVREASPERNQKNSSGPALTWVISRLERTTEQLLPELAKLNGSKSQASQVALTSRIAAKTAIPGLDKSPRPSDASSQRVIWKLEFAGKYADVQAALAELARQESIAIPVQLEMAKAKPNLTLRRWTLALAL